jgi:hypothetical protein
MVPILKLDDINIKPILRLLGALLAEQNET